jgi:CRISPR-associated protein Csa1
VVPSELSGQHLSVGDIASGYCPTYRDLYLMKLKHKRTSESWGRYTGRKIHETYESLVKQVQLYVLQNEENLANLDLGTAISNSTSQLVDDLTSDFGEKSRRMKDKPDQAAFNLFKSELSKILRFEGKLAGSLLDASIATGFDIKISSELAKLFPIQVMEPSLTALPLGFSPGVKPDFLVGPRFIGDIKTGPPKQFHKLTVAAYALAYEYQTEEPMDFGIVFHVAPSPTRSVPDYRGTEFFVISDKFRRAVIATRNRKFQILKEMKDPGEQAEDALCIDCPFYPGCRTN